MRRLREVSLSDWLSRLPPPDDGHLLIGSTGHLLLSPAERDASIDRLRDDVLPAAIGLSPPSRVTLVTGMAPGSDLLFKQVAVDWLGRAGIAVNVVALLPVPVDVLLDDWLRKAHPETGPIDRSEIEAMRRNVDAVMSECSDIVSLLPRTGERLHLGDESARQQQYRRLAACLVEQCDVLVALLRADRPVLPGGTAEVVEWRLDPARVPDALSTLALRQPRQFGKRLVLLDPTSHADHRPDSASRTVVQVLATDGPVHAPPEARLAEALKQCRHAQKSGNYLLSYDLATRAQSQGLTSPDLDYALLLALANAGSTLMALTRLRALNTPSSTASEDLLALEGRLLKDLAIAGHPDRAAERYRNAGLAYRRAFMAKDGYFSAINAATMLLLGGAPDDARPLAEAALARVRDRLPQTEQEAYFFRVTEAEAALLLGDLDRARSTLASANRLLRGDVNVRSRTAAQLRLICRHLGTGHDLIGALSMAPVLYLPRPAPGLPRAGAALPSAPLPDDASFVFSGLTEPAELDIAEPFLLHGCRVHLVLPLPRVALIEHWQRHHGEAWAQRLIRGLDRAAESSVAQGFLDGEDGWSAAYVSATACGLSRLMARRLGCGWQAFDGSIAAGPPTDADAFGEALLKRFEHRPRPVESLDGKPMSRRVIGVLFADFSGYSRLDESEMPLFQSLLAGAIAETLARHQPQVLRQHTWGDAVHIVTVDARSAARIATEIHSEVDRLRTAAGGMLARLELRLSAHYAPVFEGIDPVEGTTTYFGTQLSFAARIEPVTPPGMIFVTEAFAARLALEAPDRYVVDYAGEVELPKRFGTYRLFSLRRAEAEAAFV